MPTLRHDPTIAELLADWRDRWLPSLERQVLDLHHRRQIHDDFLAMLKAQDHPGTSVFVDVFHRMYIESQAMAIRRQADVDSRTLSFRRLLGQLQYHRKELTREWYVGRWMERLDLGSADERVRLEVKLNKQRANQAFDRFTDSPGDELLGGRRLEADRQELLDMTETVVRYVNEHIAHIATDPTAERVTYQEFEGALEHLGGMLKRYYLPIHQDSLISPIPAIQVDWKGPFRRPLA